VEGEEGVFAAPVSLGWGWLGDGVGGWGWVRVRVGLALGLVRFPRAVSARVGGGVTGTESYPACHASQRAEQVERTCGLTFEARPPIGVSTEILAPLP
jgi:hypothetical protein